MRLKFQSDAEKKWNPDGFHFLGIEESKKRRIILAKIYNYFENRGYSEVIPPAFDFTSSFQNHVIDTDRDKILKTRDSNGVELSPSLDLTIQVVKGLAGYNTPESSMKVFYIGRVIKDLDGLSGERREFTQAGAEIIGGNDSNTILQILELIDGLLNELNIPQKITLVLGNLNIVISILEKLNIEKDLNPYLLSAIITKNKYEIENLLKKYPSSDLKELLITLLLNFNQIEVIPKLKNIDKKYSMNLGNIINETENILDKAISSFNKIDLCIDFSLIRDLDYYTGFIFHGYIDGISNPILTGGAYDSLFEKFSGKEKKSSGFAFNVDIYEDTIDSKN